MSKPITAIVAAVAVVAMAGPSMAFFDDFDGAGYNAGSEVPAPWVTSGDGNGKLEVSPNGTGFGGTASDNGAYTTRTDAWDEMEAATGYPDDTMFQYRVKFIHSANDDTNGYFNGKVGPDVSDWTQSQFYWEHDPSPHDQINWYFEQGGHPGQHEGAFTISHDTWYELIMTATPAGGGDGEDWDVSLQHREWNGASWNAAVTDLATVTWTEPTGALPFNPTEVRLDAYGDVSGTAVDDISVLIPEPATMALLGLGGLMVLRRRRSA